MLKRILSILIFILCFSIGGYAQVKPAAEPAVKMNVINYYPNPANAVINFDFVKGYNRTYSLTIYNFIGKPVMEVKNLNIRNTLNLDAFYRGIYIFKLIDRNGLTVESGKFQVVK